MMSSAKKNTVLSVVIRSLISALFVFLYFWFDLPALNLRNPGFWAFLIISMIVTAVIFSFGGLLRKLRDAANSKTGKVTPVSPRGLWAKFKSAALVYRIIAYITVAVIVIFMLSALIFSPLFCASQYKDLIQSETGDFAVDVAEISWSQIPVVDRDSASRLGSRKLGEIDELVSQFEVAENYTQINYQDKPVRVTPLVYGDIFKWIRNQAKGIPAYIKVDMVTQEATLENLETGIRYSEGEYFMRNINRYLRFQFPTLMYDNLSFEIDDAGTPYWVASTYTYRIGLASGRDCNGAVLVNAITGEATRYALGEIPTWVDQVYDAEMVLQQLEYYGAYQGGFWNSVFGQAGVKYPTDGYNYLAIDDDVWLYTGMTSAGGDESNVGFVLVNLRTKETKYFTVPGAEEYSAMSSAEGQEQHLNYVSTFPILLNIEDRPTYFMSLKDNAGLVKKYAFVDVEQYQIVGTGNTVESARETYLAKLAENNILTQPDDEPTPDIAVEVTGVIAEIHAVVKNGNTVYYFRLVDDSTIYTAAITQSDMLPFVKAGDSVRFTHAVDSTAVAAFIE